MNDYLSMPDELPATPTGWKQQFAMHMRLAKRVDISTYKILDDKGRLMPIVRQTHSKDRSLCGFILPGVQPCMSWAELRALWPRWIERARKKQRERTAAK